jgi:hypothetical protein
MIRVCWIAAVIRSTCGLRYLEQSCVGALSSYGAAPRLPKPSCLSIIGRVAGPLIPICGVMMRGTLAQTARVNERRLFGWVPV